MSPATGYCVLTLRAARDADINLVATAKSLVANDLWPVSPDERAKVHPGDSALLFVSGIGLVGEARVVGEWAAWTAIDRRLIPASPALDMRPGGIRLVGAELWAEATPLDPSWRLPRRPDARTTHDVESINEEEWRSLRDHRLQIGSPWRPAELSSIDVADPTLAWVAVEEVIDDVARIEVARWPRVRDAGPTFPVEPSSVWVSASELASVTSPAATGSTEAASDDERPKIRSGTTLAAHVQWGALDAHAAESSDAPASTEVDTLVDGEVVEITPTARELAQATFYEATVGLPRRGGEPSQR